jgi:hypothetical protein
MLGWSSAISDYIVENENHDFFLTVQQFGLVISMMPLGAAFSSLFVGILRRMLGTRLTVFVFVMPIIIGYSLISMPNHIGMVSLSVCMQKFP